MALVVPPGLQRLVEVDEVTLKNKRFFTRSGQTLFLIHRKKKWFGPSFHLKLQDPNERNVVSLYTESGEGWLSGDSHLKVTVLPECTIGFVKVSSSSRKISASIQMRYGQPMFTAELPLSHSEKMIEIFSVNGSSPVAKITKMGKKESSEVIFQFPMAMEASLKTLILATFLYMMYKVKQQSRSSSSSSDSRWATSGDDGFLSYGGCGVDWGGGGGGDCGGGGGDCGGGGGDSGGGCD